MDNASPTSEPMTPLSDGQLWSLACEAYGDDLPVILLSLLSAYERRPGLNNPIRVHRSVIGVDGFTALRGGPCYTALQWFPSARRLLGNP